MIVPIRELPDFTWAKADALVCETLQPVVARQAFRDWKPVRHWNADYLNERVGKQRVQVSVSDSGEFPVLDRAAVHGTTLPLGELFARLRQPPPPHHYLNGGAFFFDRGASTPALDALQADVRLDDAHSPYLPVRSALWIGGQGALSRLHFDGNGCHNLNIQVTGRKEFVLVPPAQAARLRLLDDPAQPGFGHFSRFDRVALSRGAALPADMRRWHCELEPGDALVIPALWFHAVRSAGPLNINVNFWGMSGQDYLGRLLTQLCA